ncbi:MAG TPA: amino acid adenylation domain-containing protein, partial [Pseudonocardiaceae bacterium]|nr:amino acid adenylation domain-containing protein [Pseudonocardiaceae bacterium]
MTAGPEQRYFVFPASRAQQRLYFLQRLLGDEPTYVIPLFFAITGRLDVAALSAAIGDVVDRHEALRTHFAVEGDTLVQVIEPHAEPSWRVDAGTGVAAWMAAETGRPFDLDGGPLFRAALLRRGADDFVLVLAMHHIVADGWSVAVLLRDLQAAYRARAIGGDGPAEPRLQYADFSSWQDKWLAGSAAARQLRYWGDALGGELPVLRLPADRPRRPGVPATAGDSHPFALPVGAVRELAALCRAEGCTLFAGLLSAFAVLLHRYSGMDCPGLDTVVIGSPVANRTREEFDGTIGLFVNTVAVRCDLTGGPTFRELLRRVGRAAVDAYANQELPFELVVRELNPDRGADRDPVFQVMFSLHNAPRTSWDLPGLLVSELESPVRNVKFELELDILDTVDSTHGVESGPGPAAVLQYRTELFDADTVRRLARHYCRLLEGIAVDPDRPVATLPMLTDAERAELLPVPHPTEPVELCCHELFERQAACWPDAVAVSCGADRLTYRQLDERANGLAHRLRAAGVGPEVLVGLCAERSVDLVVGILGIAKAGGAYVPLDPGYPDTRLALLVRDGGIGHLVVDSSCRDSSCRGGACRDGACRDGACRDGAIAERFAWFDGHVVPLDGPASIGWPAGAPASGVSPEHLAYVIHTSGSTGQPKGTLVTHRNVARLFTAARPWFDFDHHDVWTMFHSFAFDFSVWELWGALTSGGRLVVVPPAVGRSPADFHRLLREHRATVLNQTPSAFRQLLAADERIGGELSLRYVILGGEALDPATLRPWIRRHGDERPRLVNMYGITETTVHVTYHRIRTGDLDRGGSPIGVPLADLQVCVLDANGEPVPAGVPGELVVSGAGVARGYLGRPELTARRFIRHPADPSHPAYRTGDLVKRLPGGALEYLGRIDDQVKIRGFRVEPGEIEAALVRHPRVREAAVLAVGDAGGDRRLVAYVVFGPGDRTETCSSRTETDDTPGGGELRGFLLGVLPEHLVPAEFVVLERLPLTAHGKVDRARLAKGGGRRVEAGRFAAPTTAAERAL